MIINQYEKLCPTLLYKINNYPKGKNQLAKKEMYKYKLCQIKVSNLLSKLIF